MKRYSDLTARTLRGSTVYVYDDARRVTSITHKDGAGTTVDSFSHQYDNDDKVTQETSTLGPTRNYSYDDSDQLTGDGTSTWTFDKNGNRTNTGYQTTTGNRLTTDGTWNFTYDDEGNVTQKQHGSTAETWTYFYNQLNQLVKAEHETTSGGGIDKRLEFKYDVFGNRIEKSYDADGDGSGTATVTRFAYDQAGNAWADLNGSSSLTTRRLYLDAVDSLFARMGASGTPDWYLTDRLGSVRDIMNNSGSIIDHIDYAGFGVVTNETSPSNGDRYKFTGREYDSELASANLAYYRARYYRFDVGLWLSEDPKRFDANDPNLYRYSGNSPTNYTDPSGLDYWSDMGAHQVVMAGLYAESFGGDRVSAEDNSRRYWGLRAGMIRHFVSGISTDWWLGSNWYHRPWYQSYLAFAQQEVLPRGGGVLQAAWGTAQMYAAYVIAPYNPVAATGLAALGADNFLTGSGTAITGQARPTLVNQSLNQIYQTGTGPQNAQNWANGTEQALNLISGGYMAGQLVPASPPLYPLAGLQYAQTQLAFWRAQGQLAGQQQNTALLEEALRQIQIWVNRVIQLGGRP